MSNQGPSLPPPGWYADPEGQPGLRWWNGTAWTNDRSAPAPAAPGPGSPQGGAPVGRQPGQIRNVGDWLNKVFSLTWSRAGHLFTIVAVLSLPIAILSGLGLYLLADNFIFEVDADSGDFSWVKTPSVNQIILISIAAVMGLIGSVWVRAALQRQTMAAYRDNPQPWADSIVQSFRTVPRVIGSSLLVGLAMTGLWIVVVLLTLAVPVLGALVMIVVVFGGFVLLIARLGLFYPSLICAPKGSGGLGYAWRLSKPIAAALLGRLILLGIMVAIIGLTGSAVSSPFGTGADPAAMFGNADTFTFNFKDFLGNNWASMALIQMISSLVGGIGRSLTSSGTSIIYSDVGGEVDPVLAGETAATA